MIALIRTIMLGMALPFLTLPAQAGTVTVYAATDRQIIEPLLADFQKLNPQIHIDYHDLQSTELQERFLKETGKNSRADVVWSSAMDLQMKLVNDGHATSHRSRETQSLPSWANWKSEAFATTFEPVCFAYNPERLSHEHIPQSHAELARFLRSGAKHPPLKVVTYDPHQSGLGYLLHSQDLEANPVVFWNLIEEMSDIGLRVESTTTEMLEKIMNGQATFGYNVLCSYAETLSKIDARIRTITPRDYTLVISRIAFISRYAPHPDEAKVLLDYLLSKAGQTTLNLLGLHSVRPDVESDASAASLQKRLGNTFRPIALNTGLLTYLDASKRKLFLQQWDRTLSTSRKIPIQPSENLRSPPP